MDTLGFLMQGMGVALQPMNLFWVTLGGVLGTIVGMWMYFKRNKWI